MSRAICVMCNDKNMKTIQQSYTALNKTLGVEVYLKREDLHKYGSHKGRSIPLMIKKYFKEEDTTDFVISSSGNAALAAIHAIQSHNRNNPKKLKLTVYIGQKIDKKKLKKLTQPIEDTNIKLEQVERPKQTAFQMDKDGTAKNLRQSTDDNALFGYHELAAELNNIPNLQAIFVPTSSGTTAQALAEAFDIIEPSTWGGKQNPEIHIIQTTACHPIAKHFDTNFEKTEQSCAGAIVDKIAHRKNVVLEAIKKTNGSGWIVNDDQIKQAQKIIKATTKISSSPNAALSVAGLQKALEKGKTYDRVVVCLLTGL